MWGQVVRSAREWARMTTVYFPEALHPEALSLIQVWSQGRRARVMAYTWTQGCGTTACRRLLILSRTLNSSTIIPEPQKP